MPDLRRNRIPGGTDFFTANVLDRRSTLLVSHIETLRNVGRKVDAARPFHIDAWVVLPDHMHAVWTLPPDDFDDSGQWKAIKIAFTKAVPKSEWRSPARVAKGERGIFQRRFRAHPIRDAQDHVAHIDSKHVNPVKHGLVETEVDCHYSSFHRFEKQVNHSNAWAANNVPDLQSGERDS